MGKPIDLFGFGFGGDFAEYVGCEVVFQMRLDRR
jgi:hypothetical protein